MADHRFSRRSLIAALILALAVVAAFAMLCWRLWATQEAERGLLVGQTERRAQQLAGSVAQRVEAMVRSVDYVLWEMQRWYGVDQPAFATVAERLKDGFPGDRELLLWLAVAGAGGNLDYSSLAFTPPLRVADREHFRVHLGGGDRLYISEPLMDPVSGAAAIHFTRPLLRDGRFAGIAMVSLSPGQIEKVLASLGKLSGAEIALLKPNGTVLASAGGNRLRVVRGSILRNPPWPTESGALPGVVRRGSVLGDEGEVIAAWNPVADAGLMVIAELGRDGVHDTLARQFDRSWAGVAILGAMLLAGGAGGFLLRTRLVLQRRALAESEARYRSLTQLSSDWQWEQDAQFRFTRMGGNVAVHTGIAVAGYLGRTRWEIPTLNLDASDWARHRTDLEARRTFRNLEILRLGTDGIEHWISVSGEPVFDESGAFSGYRGVAREITDRKRAERELRDMAERLRLGQATARMLVMDWDIPRDRIFWSDSPAWLRGPLPESGRYPLWKDQVHPEDRDQFLAVRNRSVETLQGDMQDYRLVRTDGEVRWLRSHQKVIPGRDGRAARMIVALLDITERRQAEQQLHEQARLLELIFRHSIDSVVLLDRDFNFVRVSNSYARACRREPAEFAGRNHFDLYPSDFREEAERTRAEKRIYRRTARPFVFPDHPEWGQTYWDIGLVPILDGRGEVELFLFTLRDVTEQVRATAALSDSESRLRALGRQLRDLEERERRAMARELHDRVGQNLSTLDLMLGMLAQQIVSGHPFEVDRQIKQMREVLRASVGHVRDLMSELRPPALEEYGLLAALKDLAADIAQKTGLRVQVEGEPPDPRPALRGELAIYRIAQEALSNVVRHARAEGARLRLATHDGRIELAISDDGVGFDREAGRRESTRGLATMRERAEEAGIDFALESAPGRGTRVVLTLREERA